MRRWLLAPLAALVAVLLLFAFLRWAITPADHGGYAQGPKVEGVTMVKVRPDAEPPPPDPLSAPEKAPPPPPDAPPSLTTTALPSISAPALANVAMEAGPVNVAVNIDTTGLGIGTGAFGGFLRGGAGGGGGGGGNGSGGGAGYAGGKSFKGRDLIPLSTARPQMPEWACKQKIKGWVEVVFTVMPNGRVRDVKIVDADPRGVYEAAAVESVSNWIYSSYAKAREVKQRVQMDPEDCAYNYPQ
jgi:protein TonB